MTLKYNVTLEELAEPMVRHYMRTKTAPQARMQMALWSGAGCFLLFYVNDKVTGRDHNVLFVTSISMACIVLCYLGYKRGVRMRIQKYLARERKEPFPAPQRVSIQSGNLEYESSGVIYLLSLADITLIAEDEKSLEVVFGSKGLCVIPLHAFDSAEQKAEFVGKLERI